MDIQINNRKISIVQGDIVEQETDAIVNAANNQLWMGSGVAGAIKNAGGEEIETEAIEKGPINVGESVLTSGGKLKANYVVHAAGMGQDLKTNVTYISNATQSALKVADEAHVQSISFPAIGTGVGGVEVHQCASAMLNQTIEFLQSAQSLREVRFVLFDEETTEAFNAELRHMFEKH